MELCHAALSHDVGVTWATLVYYHLYCQKKKNILRWYYSPSGIDDFCHVSKYGASLTKGSAQKGHLNVLQSNNHWITLIPKDHVDRVEFNERNGIMSAEHTHRKNTRFRWRLHLQFISHVIISRTHKQLHQLELMQSVLLNTHALVQKSIQHGSLLVRAENLIIGVGSSSRLGVGGGELGAARLAI